MAISMDPNKRPDYRPQMFGHALWQALVDGAEDAPLRDWEHYGDGSTSS